MLHLGIQTYTRDDFAWHDPPATAGGGSFGIVHKVKLEGKEDVALKVFKHAITKNNAQVFLREFAAVRFVHQNPSTSLYYCRFDVRNLTGKTTMLSHSLV